MRWIETHIGSYCVAQNPNGLQREPSWKGKTNSSEANNFESGLLYQIGWKYFNHLLDYANCYPTIVDAIEQGILEVRLFFNFKSAPISLKAPFSIVKATLIFPFETLKLFEFLAKVIFCRTMLKPTKIFRQNNSWKHLVVLAKRIWLFFLKKLLQTRIYL